MTSRISSGSDRLFGDLDGVFGAHFKHRHACLFADDLQLVDSRRTVNVAGDQQRTAVLLFLEHFGELGGMGRLTGALQAAHHNDRRRFGSKFETLVFAAHQRGELLVYDLDNHLRRRQALHHVLTDSALGHLVGKVLGNLVVDVRLEQRKTHLAHCLLDVRLTELALVFQPFERAAELVGKSFKSHKQPLFFQSACQRGDALCQGGGVAVG